MKPIIAIAALAVILVTTFLSCNLFRDSNARQAFHIEGEWLIDSIQNKGSDSSGNMGIFLLSMATKDSLPLGISFNADSTYHFINVTDSLNGKYYFSDDLSHLFVSEDGVTHQLQLVSRYDSAFVAASPDSIYYHLRRK